ncbi:MAG: hypothetical protein RR912_04355 [Clostridium sp.]
MHRVQISSEDLIKLDDFILKGVTYYKISKDFGEDITELTLKMIVGSSQMDS